MRPNFDHESQLNGFVTGVDEAGRGPWAGPVVAAACILGTDTLNPQLFSSINDSKKLTKIKREDLYHQIILQKEGLHLHGIGEASVQEIDSLNILQATLLAMTRAVEALPLKPHYALVDGNKAPQLDIPTQTLVKGDAKSLSIAAASIIAKVHRDQLMEQLALDYPHYGWESNAGYGTKTHQEGLAQYGVTPHHRTSYAPIRKYLTRAA